MEPANKKAKPDWNVEQYEKFKAERTQPFLDLIKLVDTSKPIGNAVDLGCGTGEMTALEFHRKIKPKQTIGMDSSSAMLKDAKQYEDSTLKFEQDTIESYVSKPENKSKFSLVLSNAALHWIDDQEWLYKQIYDMLEEGGQMLVQIPANHLHYSQLEAIELAKEEPFVTELKGWYRKAPVKKPEEYATLLNGLGFKKQAVYLRVYGQILAEGDGVAQWVKGSTLTDYEKRMKPESFQKFFEAYQKRLIPYHKNQKNYFFPFARIFMWAVK